MFPALLCIGLWSVLNYANGSLLGFVSAGMSICQVGWLSRLKCGNGIVGCISNV